MLSCDGVENTEFASQKVNALFGYVQSIRSEGRVALISLQIPQWHGILPSILRLEPDCVHRQPACDPMYVTFLPHLPPVYQL